MSRSQTASGHGGAETDDAPAATMLHAVLRDAQGQLAFDTLRLGKAKLKALAETLTGFAADIHSRLGIWAAYEAYNREYFGVPLPFAGNARTDGITRDRVQHLLWIAYQELTPGLVLSPQHRDLESIAEVVCTFLGDCKRRESVPSLEQELLGSSNRYGWEVKCKLIWLGTRSYFFRLPFERYVDENNRGRVTIPVIDDFICQTCTRWSGLGVIDILARLLDISQADRRDLRHWYERHSSFYRIQRAAAEYLDAVNVICDRSYRIRIDMPDSPFRAGQLIFGSLVPWRSEWYWSGEQQLVGDAESVKVDELRDKMKRENSHIVCRFWPEYEAQVRERANMFHQTSLARNGRDLITYPDGLSLAAAWQSAMQADWDARPKEEVAEVVHRLGLKVSRPQVNVPRELVEQDRGIGVFLNPDEGQEIMYEFDTLVQGLGKKGAELTDTEQDAIQNFIESDAISPAFVKRVLSEHGDTSVKQAFRLPADAPDFWLDYLLRSRKGHFYRNRYPSLAMV